MRFFKVNFEDLGYNGNDAITSLTIPEMTHRLKACAYQEIKTRSLILNL